MPVVAGNLPYSGVPSVEPSTAPATPFQQIRATPDEFGAIGGEQLSRLGQQVGQASETLAGTATFLARVDADKASNDYQDYETKLLYGDPNVPGDLGFFGKKGEDAVKAMPQVRDALLKAREDFRKKLPNNVAALDFDTVTRRLQAVTLTNIGRHFVSESEQYGKETAIATQKNGLTAAAQAIAQGDDAGWEAGVGRAMKGVMDELTRTGQANNPEIVNQKLQEIRGQAVKIKAEEISNKNPLAAAEFIRNNIDAMNGDEGNQLLAKYRGRAQALQADVDNGFAAPPKSMGKTDKYDGAQFNGNSSGDILGKYATGNAVIGGPSSVEGVHPEFARRIDTMAQAMPPGIQQKFNIISGFRSSERQAQVNPSVKNSHHTQGMAVDTTNDPDVINWINQNGPRFGVAYTLNYMPNEQNHLEPIEEGQRVPVEEAASWAQFNRGGKLAEAPDKVDNWEVKHNNFGGIRKAGVTAGPNAGGFESFATPQDGVSAIVQKLHRWSTEGVATEMNPTGGPLQSLRQIITVWAPPNENDTTDLIARASKLTGFAPDDRLDLNQPSTMAKVTEAIIRNEHGGKLPVSPTIIANAAGQTTGFSLANDNAQITNPALVRLASNDPDQLIPQPARPLPKIDRALPPLDQGEVPDAQLPGMSEQLERLMKTIPPDETERWNAAVKRARQVLNAQYSDSQRAFRLHQEEVKATSEATKSQYQERFSKESVPEAQILTDKRLTPEAQQNLVHFQRSLNKQDPDQVTDKANTMELFKRITAPYGDPTKITTDQPIWDAGINKQISRQSMDWLQSHLKNQQVAAGTNTTQLKNKFIELNKHVVEGDEKLSIMDSERGIRMFNFVTTLDKMVEDQQKAGKDPVELFTPKDPKDPFSSPAGQLLNMPQFQPPYRRQMAPATPPGADDLNSVEGIKAAIRNGHITYQQGLQQINKITGAPIAPSPPVR